MNINPFGPTTPHYDSYDDFYKFFEVYPKELNNGMPVLVFPPAQLGLKEREKISEDMQDKKESR